MRCPAYPKYRDSGVHWLGDIPVHWLAKPLKFVATYQTSNVDKKSDDDEIPVRLCNYTDVYYRERIRPDQDFMEATATPAEVARFRLRVGDVLITKDSEDWRDIAVPALVEETADDLVCGYHLGIVRPASAAFGPYLFRVLQSGAVNQQFQIASTGVTRFGLANSAAASAVLPLPPLDEQREIAAFLDRETSRIDTLVEKKRLLIERLEEQRTALISRTVTRGLPPEAARAAGLDPAPRLKPSGVEWLGDVPEHWEVKRLRHLGEAIIGLTYDPGDVVDEGEGTLLLRATNVQRGAISFSDNTFVGCNVPERLITRDGDILICSRSGSRALIGKCAMIRRGISDGLTFGAFMTVLRSECNDYLYHVFNSAIFEHQSGSFLTSTINQLTVSNLKSFSVPLPPPAERAAIVSFLDQELAEIAAVVQATNVAIERLQEYRAALITAAVTGKIDVRAPAGSMAPMK